MEIPQGMTAEDNECLILRNYVWARLKFKGIYNKLVSALKDYGLIMLWLFLLRRIQVQEHKIDTLTPTPIL
jgi:hypothetical protein